MLFWCIRRASPGRKVIGGTMVAVSDIDWEILRNRAYDASVHAYAPYSGFRVGAAGVTADARIVTGCNVENVSFGLTLCAETVLVGNLFSLGGGRLRALVCCDADGEPLMPCGRCRQVLFEFAPDARVVCVNQHGEVVSGLVREFLPHGVRLEHRDDGNEPGTEEA